MTKKEQFLEAVRKNFEEAEHRRQWLRTNLETYRTKALEASQNPETGRDRTAELIAGMLAQQLANLEIYTLGRCYMAFKNHFKGDVRLLSERLKPIRTEALNRNYNAHIDNATYRFFGYEVRSDIQVKRWNANCIQIDILSESLKDITKKVEADQQKTLGDIVQEAETIAMAWNMMEKARKDYDNNIEKLRKMLGNIRYDNEFKYAFSVSAY